MPSNTFLSKSYSFVSRKINFAIAILPTLLQILIVIIQVKIYLGQSNTLKMWAKHDGEDFNFNKAFDRIFRAFGIYQDMLAIIKDTDGETFEAFALSALDRWTDVKRFKMIKMIEEKCNIEYRKPNRKSWFC